MVMIFLNIVIVIIIIIVITIPMIITVVIVILLLLQLFIFFLSLLFTRVVIVATVDYRFFSAKVSWLKTVSLWRARVFSSASEVVDILMVDPEALASQIWTMRPECHDPTMLGRAVLQAEMLGHSTGSKICIRYESQISQPLLKPQ